MALSQEKKGTIAVSLTNFLDSGCIVASGVALAAWAIAFNFDNVWVSILGAVGECHESGARYLEGAKGKPVFRKQATENAGEEKACCKRKDKPHKRLAPRCPAQATPISLQGDCCAGQAG